ncbi:MAG: PQ-loop domain-containing transporter [Rubrivivax sp.]|nr:PQ-loop domain-containing transporter [Rubrivivax sp.]
MNLHDTLGYLAAALTTGSFVPQALLTLRTRDVRGISLGMYGAFTLGRSACTSTGSRLPGTRAQRQPAAVSARATNSASSWWP